MVDPSELAHERILTGVVLLDQHQLELAVDVLNDPGYFFVLNKLSILGTRINCVDHVQLKNKHLEKF